MGDSANFDVLETIRQAVVGRMASIPGPFGARPLIYADYTASGRSLDFVERAIETMVGPFYANTHTETSYTGLQTTRFREQARAAIRSAVGADQRHAVIFAGSGATSAINKLARVMGLCGGADDDGKAVIFVGPYEHHSNELVWRESRAEVVRIPLDEHGQVCLHTLAREVAARADFGLKIGSFSAASNVTGIRTDMRAVARTLHQHGAWFFSDYAAAGPYVEIDMAESAPGADDHCDAIFVSPHKFVGGPGASGVLVADRRLLASAVPSVPGGGTVSYVNASMHRYVKDEERREEAGTPAIIGDIRAGMVFALKADIGVEQIEALERRAVQKAFAAWESNPAIEVLGSQSADRLAIFSFNVRAGGKYLHPNFVVAVLNDLFGIQVRGGCSCAGPYGHDLLGINDAVSGQYDALMGKGLSVFRPGWVRLNFNFFIDDAEFDYIVAAVDFVARRGSDLLAIYQCDPASGRWRHDGRNIDAAFGFDDLCSWRGEQAPVIAEASRNYGFYLAEAETVADRARLVGACAQDGALSDPARWFVLAGECAA